jgi:hypothetical protein
VAMSETQNGKPRFNFSLPTFGCEGCESRKTIMGAGSWQADLAVVAIILIGCVILYKVKVA